jgi:ribonuclease HII
MASLEWEHKAIVRGDGLIHSISCASIVAKVFRDRLMGELGERYPGYGWDHNAGYGTKEHRGAIERLGISPCHRKTFLGQQYGLGI